jgi:hypothetical protein
MTFSSSEWVNTMEAPVSMAMKHANRLLLMLQLGSFCQVKSKRASATMLCGQTHGSVERFSLVEQATIQWRAALCSE